MKDVIYSYESRLENDLLTVISNNKNKRIVVVGTTCTGKSSILKKHPKFHDMDELIFPLLNQEEKEYVCQTPWTEEIGNKMNEFVKQRVKLKPGLPVFGTVLLDSDIAILISLNKMLLEGRCKLRGVNMRDAINMNNGICSELQSFKNKKIEIKVIPDDYFYCAVIEESLIDNNALQKINQYYHSTRIEEVDDEKYPIWHVQEYHIPEAEMEQIFKAVCANLKPEWYIHAFNEIKYLLIVGLHKKYFSLPTQKDESWNKMIQYGEQVGIGREWTEDIPLRI